jgi:hypothetical protein
MAKTRDSKKSPKMMEPHLEGYKVVDLDQTNLWAAPDA